MYREVSISIVSEAAVYVDTVPMDWPVLLESPEKLTAPLLYVAVDG